MPGSVGAIYLVNQTIVINDINMLHLAVSIRSKMSIECFREEPMGPESVELYRTVTGVDSESHRLRIRLNGPCTEQAVDYSPDPEG